MVNRKQCQKCKSSDVQHYKPTGKGTFHQFCRCGYDMTAHSLSLINRTRRNSIKMAPRKRSNAVGVVLVIWAVGVLLSLPFIPSTMAYERTPQDVLADHEDVDQIAQVKKVESIPEKIQRISKEHGVNAKEIEAIIDCETGGTGSTTIQSRVTGRKGRELSFGLSQIHISAHKEVSYEQAIDPDFAIDFLASHWSKGHREMWYLCSKKLNLL